MNKRINKFLLAEEKFTSEMHLSIAEFTYSVGEIFTKNKEKILKF